MSEETIANEATDVDNREPSHFGLTDLLGGGSDCCEPSFRKWIDAGEAVGKTYNGEFLLELWAAWRISRETLPDCVVIHRTDVNTRCCPQECYGPLADCVA